MIIVMIGAPGAGKGTQAKLLQAQFGIPQISTGDLFREHLRNESELGQLAKRYMEQGVLVPDQVTVEMVRERLSRPDCVNGAIFDGFPRSRLQAESLEQLLNEMGMSVDVVPYIFVEPELLIARLLKRAVTEGRADDNEETIRMRMRVYDEQTAPLLHYYEEKGLLCKIMGQQSVEAVQSELLKVITAMASDEMKAN